MGWTSTYGVTGSQVTAQVLRSYQYENETTKSEVLAHSIQVVRGVAYLAVRITRKASGETFVYAGVALIRFTPNAKDGYTFSIKEMDETVGPCQKQCPKRILDLLTPLPPRTGERDWAHDWREACRANLERKASLRKTLKPGATVTLPYSVRVSGEECQTFTATSYPGRRGRTMMGFRTPEGRLCRLGRSLLLNATIG